MTHQQKNIAIAEACGWRPRPGCKSEYLENPQGCLEGIHSYTTDLNAMHEAEEMMTEDQRIAHSDHTYDIACRAQKETGKWRWISLTAAQRAEAFLRTVGKWH